jgi:hypothetical protein
MNRPDTLFNALKIKIDQRVYSTAMLNSRAWAWSRTVIVTDIWAGSEGMRLDICETL